jgi:hypothetical protein
MTGGQSDTAQSIALRGALYYPHIHLPDIDWVKGTLLAFGQLNRIVPPGFKPNDPPEIAWLRDYPGPRNEPLVRAIEIKRTYQAQDRLVAALRTVDPDVLDSRYNWWIRRSELAAGWRHSRLDWYKLASSLARFLQERALVTADPGDAEAFMVDPELAEAIMATIAISAARHDGLDIVTDSAPLHCALAALDEDVLLQSVVNPDSSAPTTPTNLQATDQLVHIVMTTMFDLSDLTVESVAELVRDGHDLREFKARLASMAAAVPLDAAPERREALLKEVAQDVVDDWTRFRRRMPTVLRNALREGAADSAEGWLKKVGDAATAAAPHGTFAGVLAALGGVHLPTVALAAGVGIGVGATVHLFRAAVGQGKNEPFHYLTQVERRGASLLVVSKPYHMPQKG